MLRVGVLFFLLVSGWLAPAAAEVPDWARADYESAIAAYRDGDYDRAFEMFRVLAMKRIPPAQAALGHMYMNGQGRKPNAEMAAKWFGKAAENGDTDGQANYGYMLDVGLGVERNFEEAVLWYRRAAENGDASAQANLGVMYESGKGVERDGAEAMKWFRRAADGGSPRAQYMLGVMHTRGSGDLVVDYVRAHMWLSLADEQGYFPARAPLAEIEPYMKGEEIDRARRMARAKKASAN